MNDLELEGQIIRLCNCVGRSGGKSRITDIKNLVMKLLNRHSDDVKNQLGRTSYESTHSHSLECR